MEVKPGIIRGWGRRLEEGKEVVLQKESITDLIKHGCDFNCQKGETEPLMIFANTDSAHKWVYHLSCMREQMEILKEVI